MSRGSALVLAAAIVLLLVGLIFQQDSRRGTATSYGTVAGGHRGIFEVLTELGLPVERSFAAPGRLPEGTVWWIEPARLCDAEEGEEPTPAEAGMRRFVEAGGTAVVFLAARGSLYGGRFDSSCPGIGGWALPPRRLPAGAAPDLAADDPDAPPADLAADDPDAPPAVDEEPEEEEAVGPAVEVDDQSPRAQLVALQGGTQRSLEVPPLGGFRSAGEWSVFAGIADEALVLERGVGTGRLVVVADGTFLRNAWLDGGDAVLLAIDLVRAFGVPAIDEHAHGLRLAQSPATLLAELGALPVFLGVAGLGLLVLWRRTAVPMGLPDRDPTPVPALETFVDSLAALYARNRDWTEKAESYRVLASDRLRSHFGLSADVSDAQLVERLRRAGRVGEERLALLIGERRVESERTWLARARELDALVEEVCR